MTTRSVTAILLRRQTGLSVRANYTSIITEHLMKFDMPVFHENKQSIVVSCIGDLLSDTHFRSATFNVVTTWLATYDNGDIPLHYLIRELVKKLNKIGKKNTNLETLQTISDCLDEFEYQFMPKHKKTPKKRKNYDLESLQKAVQDVTSNNISLRKASMRYGVPVMTIHDHVTGKVNEGARVGRPTVLAYDVERKIVEKIKVAAKQGFGISRRVLKVKIARVIRQNKVEAPFKNGIPGKDWLSGFVTRHPDLSLRSPLPLQTVRSRMLNRSKVNEYFDDLSTFLQKLGIKNNPFRIWNMDETSIPLTHKPERVLAETGSKNVPGRVGDCRESISVLCCIRASGTSIPPMVIVKGKTQKSLNAYNVSDGVKDTKYTYQAKAWMEDVLSETWFRDHFLRFCGPERPQVILLDSHSSHETLDLIEVARENGIELFTFPPHTTHWLCPLDKTVFGPLIREYNSVCSQFMSCNPNNTVTKWNWPGLFRKAYEKAFSPSNIISGFRKCGIHPLDKDIISDDAFAPSEPFQQENFQNPVQSTSSVSRIPTPQKSTEILISSRNSDNVSDSLDQTDKHGLARQSVSSDNKVVTPVCQVNASSTESAMGSHQTYLTPSRLSLCNTPDKSNVIPVRQAPASNISDSSVATSVSVVSSTESTSLANHGITVVDSEVHGQLYDASQVVTPDVSQVLSSDELLLALLRGEIPTVTDDAGVLTLEVENVSDNPMLTASIDAIFEIPPSQTTAKKSGSKKKITSHRILTSDEIVESKRKEKEVKIQIENEKLARQKEREMKKKGVKVLGQVKAIAATAIKPCFICKRKENKMIENSQWVQCNKCKHFFHDKCIPSFMESLLEEARKTGSGNFICHICL